MGRAGGYDEHAHCNCTAQRRYANDYRNRRRNHNCDGHGYYADCHNDRVRGGYWLCVRCGCINYNCCAP